MTKYRLAIGLLWSIGLTSLLCLLMNPNWFIGMLLIPGGVFAFAVPMLVLRQNTEGTTETNCSLVDSSCNCCCASGLYPGPESTVATRNERTGTAGVGTSDCNSATREFGAGLRIYRAERRGCASKPRANNHGSRVILFS